MKFARHRPILACSLGILLFWGLPGCSPQGRTEPQSAIASPQTDILAELARANIIYLAETHDSLEDHQAQLEIIQGLYGKNQKIAIALEMFQRPFQDAIDRYLAGEISEAQLREASEYESRWGFDWKFYAPILRFAKEHQLPVLALNTPTEVTRTVAREGLEGLTPQQQQWIPPRSQIRTDNQAYRQLLRAIYDQHAQGGHGNSDSFERFFLAQVLWDETMAETIAQFWQENPNYQVVVLAGKGHIQYGYGIPSRVERRLLGQPLTQRSVWLGSWPETEPAPTDFSWPHE